MQFSKGSEGSRAKEFREEWLGGQSGKASWRQPLRS